MRPGGVANRGRVVSTTSAERFAARARHRRLGLALRVLIALIVVAALAGAGWLVGWSSVLALEEVRVDGASGSLAEHVRSTAAAPIGRPLARVDTAAIAARVSGIDDLAAVDVRRSWPNMLVVEVTQRRPAAAIRVDGRWRFVDPTGVIFGTTGERPGDLLWVDAPTGPGQADVRAGAVRVAVALPDQLRDQVERIRARRVADIRVVLAGDVEVIWGDAERSERKAEVLQALLRQEARHYDVSAPDRPAIRR